MAAKGSHLEKLILASSGGDMLLEKIPSGSRWIGPGKSVPTKSPVDFMGVWRPTMRCVVLDAKTCSLAGPSFPLGNADHFPEHQREQIVRFGKHGAVAGLLILRMKTDMLYWISWHTIDGPMGRASIAWDDMAWIGPAGKAISWELIPGLKGAAQ